MNEKQRKKVQVDERTKNKALEKLWRRKSGNWTQKFMVDRRRVKECQLNFIQVAPQVPSVPASIYTEEKYWNHHRQ